jgi:hypothetical protein
MHPNLVHALATSRIEEARRVAARRAIAHYDPSAAPHDSHRRRPNTAALRRYFHRGAEADKQSVRRAFS